MSTPQHVEDKDKRGALDDTAKIKLARGLSQILAGFLAGQLEPSVVAERLRAAAKWLESAEDSKSSTPAAGPGGPTPKEVRAVFDYWATRTGRANRNPVLSPQRSATIRARLAEGFSAAQLNAITDWCVTDPHYSGANDRNKRYDWPETMFRSASRVEDLLERAGSTALQQQSTLSPAAAEKAKEIAALAKRADEAEARGDTETYNDIQKRIREIRG